MRSNRRRLILVVVVLVGLMTSLTSVLIQYRLLGDPTYSSSCNFSAAFNCDVVYTSRFGMFLGLPVSLYGALWFAGALALSATGDLRSASPNGSGSAWIYLFLTSTVALTVTLYLTYASIAVLGSACVYCLLTGAAVAGVFVLSGSNADTPWTELPRLLARDVRASLATPVRRAVTILLLTGTASGVALLSAQMGAQRADAAAALKELYQPTEFDAWFESKMRTPVAITGEDAPVLIVKFTDYECASCAETFKSHEAVFAKYAASHPGQVRLVVRDYPLDAECNSDVTTSGHAAACEAAAAVRMARRLQRDAQMEAWLYGHQEGLTPEAVREAARDIGGVTDFDAEYSDALTGIRGDVALGHRLGVFEPPTFFINGVKIVGGLDPTILDQAIAHELRVTASRALVR